MKRIFQISLMFIGLAAMSQDSISNKEEQVKALISNSFQGIFSDKDSQALETYCTQDFLLLENGEVWDINKIKNYLAKASQQKTEVERINSFKFIEIKIEGKMAWVAYHNTAKFMLGEEEQRELNWLESASAILTEEGWKLQVLHSTLKKVPQK